RLGPRRQAEDEAVLVHLRATQVGVRLRVGEGSDRWCVVERQLHLAGDLHHATRGGEQLRGGQLARSLAANGSQKPRRPPVPDALVARGQRADDLLARARQRDVRQAALFREVQLGGGQLLLDRKSVV